MDLMDELMEGPGVKVAEKLNKCESPELMDSFLRGEGISLISYLISSLISSLI